MELPDDLVEASDPVIIARRAGDLIAEAGEFINEVSRVRREALNELVARGMNQTEIAKEIRSTRTRVGQLLGSGPPPERALLARGAVTVAIGGKVESGRSDPSAVVSAESLAAYNIIRDLCSGYSLSSQYEVVPPPGMVDLNRDNLIVIGSPRLLPLVDQVMGADKHLAFRQGARGWYLFEREGEVQRRSPADRGQAADYAYIGRLPRPDGRGTFLYFAGIHAMGTLGAAHYLADHVADLYEQVKTRRWSMLIQSNYDPDTREVTSTEAITPVFTAT